MSKCLLDSAQQVLSSKENKFCKVSLRGGGEEAELVKAPRMMSKETKRLSMREH
jgi:hypothetical protein